MNTGQQGQSDQPGAGPSEANKKYAKPHNKTTLIILLMIWPPIALIALSVLSAFVDFIATLSATTSEATVRSITSQAPSDIALPGWAEVANTLIFIGIVIAPLFTAINFIIGLVLVMKNRVGQIRKYVSF